MLTSRENNSILVRRAAAAAAGVLGYWLRVTGSFHFSLPRRGKDAKMAKLGRQGCQVRKVDGSVDFSGFGSSVPRWPSCFMGGVAAAAARSGDR